MKKNQCKTILVTIKWKIAIETILAMIKWKLAMQNNLSHAAFKK